MVMVPGDITITDEELQNLDFCPEKQYKEYNRFS